MHLTYLVLSYPSLTLQFQLQKKGKEQETRKNKDCVTDYYPPSPIQVIYEEDTPTLVNNLVPEPAPKEKKDTNKTEKSKNPENRKDVIEITDDEDDLVSDWDSD